MNRQWIRVIGGIILAFLGILWMLQGADLLGGKGGMNGQAIWIVIGAVVLLGGLAILAPLRHSKRVRPGK